jgi:hypothetical protein
MRPASHEFVRAASDLAAGNSYDRGMSGGLTPMYGMWRQYNARLVDKIRSLSDEQLKLRPPARLLAHLGNRRPHRRRADLLALRRI